MDQNVFLLMRPGEFSDFRCACTASQVVVLRKGLDVRDGAWHIIELTLCQVWSFICTLLWSVAYARHVDCCSCGPAHESSLPAHQCF